MGPSDEPEQASVPQALGRLRVALDDAYLTASREVGLTAQQAELLCAAMRPSTVGGLAVELRCDRSNVTRLVERAARRGLVRRRGDTADGRVTMIELTAAGRRVAERFIARLEDQTRPLIARWDEGRRWTASQILGEIADALDASRDETRPGHRRRRPDR